MKLGAFSDRERRILVALCEAMLPSDVGIAVSVDGVALPRRVEEFLCRLGAPALRGVGALLTSFDLSVPVFWFRWCRFVSLSRDDQVRFLRDWDESRFYLRRALVLGPKAVITMVYGSLPEVERAIGYAPGNIVHGALTEQAP